MQKRLKQLGVFLLLTASGSGFVLYLNMRADYLEEKNELKALQSENENEPLEKKNDL